MLVEDDGEVIQELSVTDFTRIPQDVRHDGAVGPLTVLGDAVVGIEDNPATTTNAGTATGTASIGIGPSPAS